MRDDLAEGVPPEGLWDDFKKRGAESWPHYLKRLCSEGHSVPDAFLTVAASQIGQIMLTTPNGERCKGSAPQVVGRQRHMRACVAGD